MNRIVRGILVDAVRPIGFEGLSRTRICAEMTKTDEMVWIRQEAECDRIIDLRVNGYIVLLNLFILAYTVFMLVRISFRFIEAYTTVIFFQNHRLKIKRHN